jgi:tetratricopeptide (TPR) repeat protein
LKHRGERTDASNHLIAELSERCGRALLRQGALVESDWDKAVQLFSQAIEIEPEQAQHYAARASVIEQSNRQEALESALSDYERAIGLSPSPQLSLFDASARLKSKLGRSAAAVADWTEAIQLAPVESRPLLYSYRAENYAKLGNWPLARDDFAMQYKATAALESGYDLIVTQLKMGDVQAYQDTCQKLHTQYAKDNSSTWELNTLTWLCVLAPNGLPDYDTLIKLLTPKVERLVHDQVEGSNAYLNSLGALHFRAGNWAEAEKLLQQSRNEQLALRENLQVQDVAREPRKSKAPVRMGSEAMPSGEAGTIWDWLFLAMTYKELNDLAAAEKWLKLAQDRFELETGESWTRRAELEILSAEAAQRIQGQSSL